MKTVVLVVLGCLVIAGTYGCNGKVDSQQAVSKAEPKAQAAEAGSNSALARQFLEGVQEGDKGKMYRAANITPEMVDRSRDKLVHMKQNKLTGQERLEYEHVLRISGDIDFFSGKLKKLFPRSATLLVGETTETTAAPDTRHYVHAVTITYGDKLEAMHDKNGRPIKTMRVHLQQIDRSFGTTLAHEFSFDNKDFDKMADREFDVITYF